MARTLIDANEELHALVRDVWKLAPEIVPYGAPNLAAFGIVYTLRDGNGEPNQPTIGPWCRVTVLSGGYGRASIGNRRRENRGTLVVQVFVPAAGSTKAGGIALRLAQIIKNAIDAKRGGIVNVTRSRFETTGGDAETKSGGYKAAIVACDFYWEQFGG